MLYNPGGETAAQAVYLIPLPNVQRKTIQPIIECLVVRGAKSLPLRQAQGRL